MKHFKILPAMFAMMALMVSCDDEDDDNDDVSQGYQVEFRELSTKNTAQWTLSSATAVITNVELEGDDADSEADIEGSYEVDLMTGASDPEMPTVETEAGTYSDLHFSLGDGVNSAMHIEASWSDTINTYNVVVDLTQQIDFDVASADSEISIESGEVNELTVYMSVQNALSTLVLTQAVVSTDNTINIGNGDNPNLEAAFLAALSAELED